MEKETLCVDKFWSSEMAEHREVLKATFESLKQSFSDSLSLLAQAIIDEKKILLFGNGGSAADAQHIAAELVIRYKKDRSPIAAIALTTDTSSLTACGNDLGFDQIFARQLEAIGSAGDVAIGISTSGNSANVIAAFQSARQKGVRTIGFTGGSGGVLKDLSDVSITVPSDITARIQEMHILIGHMLCKALEEKLDLV
jgi:D-sedoheptulose 7-phosphate isomerase